MSTTTPGTESQSESGSGSETDESTGHPCRETAGGAVRRDSPHPTRTTTGTGRPDRWADSTRDPSNRPPRTAPLTFDPACIRRLRNCIDEENAAFPDAH